MKLNDPIILKGYLKNFKDERGYLSPLSFKDLLDRKELDDMEPCYQLMSFTKNSGTFRGFHFQKAPSQQIKILALHQGSILDIIFPFDDLQNEKIQRFNLFEGDVLIIPENFAHGFYTQSSDVLIQYLTNKEFVPSDYSGFNGTKFIISETGNEKVLISEKDLLLPEINILK